MNHSADTLRSGNSPTVFVASALKLDVDIMSDRSESMRQSKAYKRLYDVIHTNEEPLHDRLENALEIGVEHFGVDVGYITQLDPEKDHLEVIVSTNSETQPSLKGLSDTLSNTFCQRTIENEAVFAFPDVSTVGLENHPATQKYGVHCYHGAPIVVNGEPYGTVCFAAQAARETAFTEQEKSFSHLIASIVGYEFEQQDYESKLSTREKELQKHAEINRALTDINFNVTFRTDRSGQITYTSSSAEELIGYTKRELEGTFVGSLYAEEYGSIDLQGMLDRALSGETVEEWDFPIEKRNGEICYVDFRGAPIYDTTVTVEDRSTTDIIGVQGIIRDATDRRRRQGFMSVIHRVLRHNLRNDVGVIRGYSDMLEQTVANDADARLALDRIQTAADRLLDISESAQNLQRNVKTATSLKETRLKPILNRVVTEVQSEYPAATINLNTPVNVVVYTSPRIETALKELIENAAKHSGESPTVSISIEKGHESTTIFVSDDGPGLPESEKTVLERGNETPLVHGTGLGLWMAYWAIANLDGSLSVSTTTNGTTIGVQLPTGPQ